MGTECVFLNDEGWRKTLHCRMLHSKKNGAVKDVHKNAEIILSFQIVLVSPFIYSCLCVT